MSISSRVIQSYGESMLLGTAQIKGFLSPVDKNDPKIAKRLAPGVAGDRIYRLITDDETVKIRQDVTYAGYKYEIMWVEQVRIFGSFSHNECVLRLKEECSNA